MSKASEVLRREHQSIRDALEVLEEFCFLLRADQEILTEDIQALTDFLGHYTHEVHQKKEELFLFPAMEKAGISREQGHFAMLIAGHEIGAVYLRHLAEAGKHVYLNKAEFVEAAESYLAMHLDHIEQEDHGLLNMADECLADPEQQDLIAEFQKYDRLAIGQSIVDQAMQTIGYFHKKYMENQD